MSETTATYATRRSPRMSADERREAIVAAGVDEFAAKGLAGASTDAIARRAGVSQPYVFQLFGTKKDLFLAVVRLCFERTRITFEAAAAAYQRGEELECDSPLGAMGEAYKRLLADRTLLLVQLQAYAACSDPDVRIVVRDEFAPSTSSWQRHLVRPPRRSTSSSPRGCSSTSVPPSSSRASRRPGPSTSSEVASDWIAGTHPLFRSITK